MTKKNEIRPAQAERRMAPAVPVVAIAPRVPAKPPQPDAVQSVRAIHLICQRRAIAAKHKAERAYWQALDGTGGAETLTTAVLGFRAALAGLICAAWV